ncbi:MAG: type II toxin-antitoxin system PemK/MazF family toxin [Deltaproteobacteria bacterium]|nr:type II toxin-antitoxin system PemK/MazF family toxin [Deltaproteobacteria bacterium]
MTYKAFDVVVVPFPFTDSSQTKKRPALVLSSKSHFNSEAKHSIMAMITSAKNSAWPLDVKLNALASAGLSADSVIRMKLFTLDHRFIIRKTGVLSTQDRKSVTKSLRKALRDIL